MDTGIVLLYYYFEKANNEMYYLFRQIFLLIILPHDMIQPYLALLECRLAKVIDENDHLHDGRE